MPLDPVTWTLIGLAVGLVAGGTVVYFRDQIIEWATKALENLIRGIRKIVKSTVRLIRKGKRYIKRMIVTFKEGVSTIKRVIEEFIEDYEVPEEIHDEFDEIQDKLGLKYDDEVELEFIELKTKN